MTLFFLIIAAAAVGFFFYMVRYLHKGSPEEQQEREAYTKLMDQLREEASFYTGRPVSEEEILQKGREYGRHHHRRY
ncbi:MAG: hypothetical protein IJS14_15340 [Lentisphaeria bacterium]|nr:hypothetical protein [Lentisphaeria bacterium]